MNFFIRSKKTVGEATLYIRIQKGNIDRWIKTPLKIDVKKWNKARANINVWSKFCSTEEGKILSHKMEEVEQIVNMNLSDDASEIDKDAIEAELRNIIDVELREKLEKERKQKEEKKAELDSIKHTAQSSIVRFYDFFIEGISNGTILTKDKKRYREGSIKTWKSYGKLIKEYVGSDIVCFNDINAAWKEGFNVFLNKKGIMLNTISKMNSCLQRMCRAAADYGLNNNAVTISGWSTRKASTDRNECVNNVYLTEEELNALYAFPLEGEEAIVRDVFYLGTCLCQRYSDYSRINSNMVKTIEGYTMIDLVQKKTGKHVIIPVSDEGALKILQRYKNNIPQIAMHRINELIKRIFKRLSVTVTSLNEEIPTAITARNASINKSYEELSKKKHLSAAERKHYNKLKKLKEEGFIPRIEDGVCYRRKWHMISTHTARRSGITNEIKRGRMDTREIMSISGHTSEKVFKGYCRLSEEEQALEIAKKIAAKKSAIS